MLDEKNKGNEAIADFLGYKYIERDVLIDNSECGGIYTPTDVFSKVPIQVNDFGDQKYFADLPNPDFGKDRGRWNSSLEKLSWATLNGENYITNLDYHKSYESMLQVVEHIERGNFGVKMCRKVVEIYFDDTKKEILRTKEASRKDSLWLALVRFVHWHKKIEEEASIFRPGKGEGLYTIITDKVKIKTIRDNNNQECRVFSGLPLGTKLLAKKPISSISDIGASGMTVRYDAFVPGKIYEVGKVTNWAFYGEICYAKDADGTLYFATPELFDVIVFNLH